MKIIGFYSIVFSMLFCSCQNQSSTESGSQNVQTIVEEVRKNPKSQAVAVFDEALRETQAQKLNAFHFKAALFETNKTFVYKLKFEFETQQEESEFAYPNLGYAPEPIIRKSTTEPQTIEIGFKGPKDEFMPFKKLVADKEGLHFRTVAKYTVKQKNIEK